MLEYIRSVYRVFVLIGFWVFLIGCTIGGGIIGSSMGGSHDMWSGRRSGGGHPILGGFIGLIIGFVIDILVYGLLATFLNIDENIEEQNRLLSEIVKKNSSLSQGNISNSGNRSIVGNKLQKKCKRCKKEVDEDYSGCPYCGNNTFE